jgi:hypothetical protein
MCWHPILTGWCRIYRANYKRRFLGPSRQFPGYHHCVQVALKLVHIGNMNEYKSIKKKFNMINTLLQLISCYIIYLVRHDVHLIQIQIYIYIVLNIVSTDITLDWIRNFLFYFVKYSPQQNIFWVKSVNPQEIHIPCSVPTILWDELSLKN